MIFKTLGRKENPAVLFFHGMGVTGDSSLPVAQFLQERYFCILPTSTVFCPGQRYMGKAEEIRQIEKFICGQKIESLEWIVASAQGANLAMEFLSRSPISVRHIFFDGGAFAQTGKTARAVGMPLHYLGMKSLYWFRGKTQKQVLRCREKSIRPCAIEAGKNLTYRNFRFLMADSRNDELFPFLPEEVQEHTFWGFGTEEAYQKCVPDLMNHYPSGNFPLFEGFGHLQYQLEDPEGFADMLVAAAEQNELPALPFLTAC